MGGNRPPNEEQLEPVTRAKGSWGEARTPRNPERHPVLTTVEERVEYVMGLMIQGKWYRHRTKLELSERWGVKPVTVQDYSVEASRAVDKALKESRAEVASLAVSVLARIARAKPKMPGDRAASKGAADSLLRFSGYAEPEEDKERANTLQIVAPGSRVTSPVFKALLGLHEGQEEPSEGGEAKAAPVVPEAHIPGPVVPKE